MIPPFALLLYGHEPKVREPQSELGTIANGKGKQQVPDQAHSDERDGLHSPQTVRLRTPVLSRSASSIVEREDSNTPPIPKAEWCAAQSNG